MGRHQTRTKPHLRGQDPRGRTPLAGAALLAALLAACGSGGGGATGGGPTPVTITFQPAGLTVNEGSPAAFQVSATGSSPLSYQWRRGGTAIAGASSATYTLASTTFAADEGATFDVVVSNAAGSVPSSSATLRVVPPIVVSQAPQDTTANEGQAATFSVTATSALPLTYQWRRGLTDIPGATASSLTTAPAVPGDGGAQFSVALSNGRAQASSGPATLTVIVKPRITSDPQSVTVTEGGPAVFTVTATGTPPLSYQWRRGDVALSGETAASLAFPAVTYAAHDGAVLDVVVTNAAGNATSAAATLHVLPVVTVTAPPQDLTVNEGRPATFSVTATSALPLTYRWQVNAVDVAGATASSYTTPSTTALDDGSLFSVRLSNGGAPVTAGPARLTVRAAPRLVTLPRSQNVAEGQTATFTVTAIGAPPLAYQWMRNAVDIPGATATSFTTAPAVVADGGTRYAVRVSTDFASVTSPDAILTVAGTNHPPSPTAPDPTVLFELDSASVQVAHGDPDAGQAHTYAVTLAPAHGTATASATGLVTYTPAAGFRGDDFLDVTVTDDGLPPLSGTVRLHFTVRRALFLTLTANPDPVVNFGTVTYELRVSNQGTAPVANVLLSDAVPSIAIPAATQISGGGTCAGVCTVGSVVSWPAFTLAPGETRTVTLAAALNGGTNGAALHGSAQVSYAGGTITATHDATVRTGAGLAIALAEDHDPVLPGDRVTYTVTVGNDAGAALPVSNLGTVTATIPPGTTFVSASAGGSATNGVVTWNLGQVAAGAAFHLGYTVAVDPALPAATMLVAGAAFEDGATPLARAQAATEVRGAPVALVVTANPEPIAAFGTITYEYRVSNRTSATQANLLLTAVSSAIGIPAATQITGGGTCTNGICAGNVFVTWPAFSLAPGETRTVTMATSLNGGASGTILRTRASAAFPGGVVTQEHDAVVSNPAGLAVALSEDHDPVLPGDRVTYTVTAGNNSGVALPVNNLGTVVASIPPGTTFVSASAGGTAANGIVTWNLGQIAASSAQRFSYTVAVGASVPQGTVLVAEASVGGGGASAVRSQAATEVRAAPLALALAAAPDPVANFGTITYTLTVTNTGALPLANVVLVDVVPATTIPIPAQISAGGTCTNGACGGNVFVTWPGFPLDPGQSATFTLGAQVNGGVRGSLLRDRASVGYPGGVVTRSLDAVVF